MKNTFYGTIKDGKLVFDHPRMVKEAIACCRDMRIEVTIKKESYDVTLDQWSYLYGCIYTPFAEHFGWTIDKTDEWVKRRFMKDNGIELPKGLTLTKTVFDREWLAKFIDSAIMYVAEEGLSVLPPNPDWKTYKEQT